MRGCTPLMVTQEGRGGCGPDAVFQVVEKGRRPKPKRDVVRAAAPEEGFPGTRDGRPFREIQDPQSGIKELERERALQERPLVKPDPPRSTSPPAPGPRQRGGVPKPVTNAES